jgi:nitrogen regulatory protein PII
MKMVIAVIKPFKLTEVREALNDMGVHGMTVTDVRGYGRQKGKSDLDVASDATGSFVNKVKFDIAVEDNQVDAVVDTILKAAGSGKVGDGKIFVYNLEQVVRISTHERGAAAI